MVLIQAVARGWALSGSWFYFDDLAFMSRAMSSGLTPEYLFESYGGHLMPGAFALMWLLTRLAAWQWWAWATLLLLAQVVAGLGMLRLLRLMFGETRVVLLLLGGYLVYVYTLPAGLWFAAGVNQLPLQIALVFGLHAHVRYLRDPSWRPLAATVAWTAFGLIFYEKTLLLFGVYALVAICWFSAGNTPERLRRIWERYPIGVLVHGAVAGLYTAVYVAYGLDFAPETAGTQPLTPIVFNLVAVAGATAAIGGPLTWQPLEVGSFADPSQLLQLMSWVVLAGVAYYAYRTRTISRRAWSLVAFTLLANVVLLGSARANVVGPDIALEYRYQTETAALLVVSAGLAFLPLLGAPVQNEVRPDAVRTYESPRLLTLAAAAVVVAAAVSSVRYVDLWQTRNPTELYYRNLVASLREHQAESGQKRVPMVDAALPQNLLWSYRYPENTYSHVFRNLDDAMAYPSATVDDLNVLDLSGELAPVDVTNIRGMTPRPGCGQRLTGRRAVIELDGPVIGGGWWVRMPYRSKAQTSVTITMADLTHELDLPAGRHEAWFLAEGDFRKIHLSGYDEEARACVTDVTLGLPRAALADE